MENIAQKPASNFYLETKAILSALSKCPHLPREDRAHALPEILNLASTLLTNREASQDEQQRFLSELIPEIEALLVLSYPEISPDVM